MNGFSRLYEFAEGIRLGLRYSVGKNHNTVAKGIQPRIAPVNPEDFGR